MDAAGGGMACGEEVVGVEPVRTVDPLKRRVALREYVKQLRGDNKENERGKECEGSERSPGLVKQKTLGLCRRHVGAVVVVAGDGMMRDKRKFNAPRQTPEKRQRPDEVSPGTDQVPRLESRVDASEEMMRQPEFSFAASREPFQLESPQVFAVDGGDGIGAGRWSQCGGRDVFASPVPSPSRQAQLPESYTLPFKWQAPEPKTPSVRKPLAPVNIPVNRQTVDLHAQMDQRPSPLDQLPSRPNASGSNGPASSGSLFQTASGKPFQASAAAKARAALLFESDAELADFFSMDL